MGKPARCYNRFKGESTQQTHLLIKNIEVNLQMAVKLAFGREGELCF